MSATQRKIESYEIVDHGIEHEQYFHGCGVSFSKYADCFTGIGDNHCEAFEDALGQAAMSGWDVDTIEGLEDYEFDNAESVSRLAATCKDHESYDSHHYYVSVRLA